MGGDNSGQLGTSFSKVRAQTERRLGAWAPPPEGKRMERGRKMHPRQVYLLIKRFFNGMLVNISFGKSH